MRPGRDSAEPALDHVIVGAGLSGLAYAWRRREEGRRVVVLEREAEVPTTPAALLEGPTPHLDRLLEAIPGAPRPAAWPGGPLHIWTAAGLRAPPALVGRLARRPGAWAEEIRARLAAGPQRDDDLRVLPRGLGALRRALVAELGDAVRFGRCATRVQPGSADTAPAVVETADGELRAREIALDVAADEQARLLEADAPHHADPLRVVAYEEDVHLVLAVPPRRLPGMAGFDRRSDAPGRIRSARLLSCLDPEMHPDGAVSVLLPASAAEDVSTETLVRIARVDLERALGVELPCRLLARERVRRVRPAPGHRGRMAELAAALGGRGLRLLGAAALGRSPERLAVAGVPVAGPLPEGATIA